MTDSRPMPPPAGDERETLMGFLDFHRATLAWKCQDLEPAQLVSRPLPPSTLSLHGLVRHLTDVERWWFRNVWAGESVRPRYWTKADKDRDFDNLDASSVAADTAAWQEEIAACNAAIAEADLSATVPVPRHKATVSLRWILTHMVEEYARHNGHADLIREHIDGRTGE